MIDELQADLSPPRLQHCYQSSTSTIPPEIVEQNYQFIKRLVELWDSALAQQDKH
ncbi:MAG: hypothetical protein PUP92_29040 [Rhizonema sp. PD38]|nr:hypothetical protein [Rhizonema sp. PD38]